MTNDEKRNAIIKIAKSQVGVKESPANSNNVKYNTWFYKKAVNGTQYSWCCSYVCWVFETGKLPLPIRTASCTELANYARSHNQWVTSGYKVGDIVFFHWTASQKNVTEYVGIILEVHSDYIVTNEGNTSISNNSNGGQVMNRKRYYSTVTGAYRPYYNM